jgi:translation initiation factor IF-3
MLNKVAAMVTDVATVEQSARLEGRHMSMMLVGK